MLASFQCDAGMDGGCFHRAALAGMIFTLYLFQLWDYSSGADVGEAV